MILALFLFAIVIPALLALPACLQGHRNSLTSWVDYVAVPAAGLFWIVLTSLGIGHQSLSHLIEIPIVAVIALVILYVRVGAGNHIPRQWQARASAITLSLCLLTPLIVRLAMPYLPE